MSSVPALQQGRSVCFRAEPHSASCDVHTHSHTVTQSVSQAACSLTALSFLGLGLRPPIVSWGVMLQDCLDVKAVRFYPWLMMPVGFIVSVVLCFNFLGDGLRDAADPYG